MPVPRRSRVTWVPPLPPPPQFERPQAAPRARAARPVTSEVTTLLCPDHIAVLRHKTSNAACGRGWLLGCPPPATATPGNSASTSGTAAPPAEYSLCTVWKTQEAGRLS